jgi:hypothetical protein
MLLLRIQGYSWPCYVTLAIHRTKRFSVLQSVILCERVLSISSILFRADWIFGSLLSSESRDNAVGTANGCGLDDLGVGVRVLVGSRIFSALSRPALGRTQPPIQRVRGTLSPGVKRLGREADHSPPTSTEVKKMWMYTSIPAYAFMA